MHRALPPRWVLAATLATANACVCFQPRLNPNVFQIHWTLLSRWELATEHEHAIACVLAAPVGASVFSNARGLACLLGACNHATRCNCVLVLAAPAEAKLLSNAPGLASSLGDCDQASNCNCMLVLAATAKASLFSNAPGLACMPCACNQTSKQMQLHVCVGCPG